MTVEKSVLYAVFKRNNLLKEYEEQEPVFVWNQIVGEVGKIARPKKVKGNSLVLEVPSAAAKQELSYLEEQFLTELNDNLDNTRIEKLKFELGRFPSRGSDQEEEGFDLDEVTLSEAELERIEEALSETKLVEETKESLRKLLITQEKKRKIRLDSGWKECPACGGVCPGNKCPYCGFAPLDS